MRVKLTDDFRDELRHEKRARVAASVHSPRGRRASNLDPSTISRYAAGTIAPTLRMARQLARALGKPLLEAVTGFAPQSAQSTPNWAARLLTSRTYRGRAVELIGMFAHLLDQVHLGVVSDSTRQHRAVIRPTRDMVGYQWFEIVLAKPLPAQVTVEFVLSFRLFDTPPVFIDYGRIQLTSKHIEGTDLWTGQTHHKALRAPTDRIWVQTWIDGKSTDFVIRSSRAFRAGRFVDRGELPRPRVVVPFRPCGMHQQAKVKGNAKGGV